MAQDRAQTAAIWWRVSTDDQREASQKTQVRESIALAEEIPASSSLRTMSWARTGTPCRCRRAHPWSV